ncbi:MAG: hypothetical protein JW982_08985 [Spirochaetes bacterium]|nr:hypothetical protein [Spirochaetota bacterium]
MPSTLFYLNSGFDIELGGYENTKNIPILNELSMNYVVLSGREDIVLSNSVPDDGFYRYLEKNGISASQNIISPEDWEMESNSDMKNFQLWGYNEPAVKMLKLKEGSYPPVESVRELNSREFCHFLKHKFNPDCGSQICYGMKELEETIEKISDFPVVIKSFFGSSGTGMMIRDGKKISRKEIGRLSGFLNGMSTGFIVEPWRERTADFSLGMMIDSYGKITKKYFNVLKNTEKGIFRSVLVSGDSELAGLILNDNGNFELDRYAHAVTEEAAAKKYYGYIGIDGYCFNEKGKTSIEPLSEINARNTMAGYVIQLKSQYSACRYARLIISRFSSSNIKDYGSLEELLSFHKFDISSGEGILLCNPLYYRTGDRVYKTLYLNFAVFANSIHQIDEYGMMIAKMES